MFFRDWLFHPPIGVGLGILALLFIPFLVQKHDQASCRDGGSIQYQICTFENVSETIISPMDRSQAPVRNPEPERSEWRQESDLYAQWTMALWAKISAAIAGIGLFITGVGLVLVKRTLDVNRAAVELSNRAIENEREIGEAQVRAYLAPIGGSYEIVGNYLKVWVKYKNFGQSPCLRVHLRGEVFFCVPVDEPRFPDDMDTVQTTTAKNQWGAVQAGGDDKTLLVWSSKQIGEKNFKALIGGRSFHRIVGTLSWVDVFKKRRGVYITMWRKGAEVDLVNGRAGELEPHWMDPEFISDIEPN